MSDNDVRTLFFGQKVNFMPWKIVGGTPPTGANPADYKRTAYAEFAIDTKPDPAQGTYTNQEQTPDGGPARRPCTINNDTITMPEFTAMNPGNYTLQVSLWNSRGGLIAYDLTKGRKLEVLPEPNGLEVVAIAEFPSPWKNNLQQEIRALNQPTIGYWEATSTDMNAIAKKQVALDTKKLDGTEPDKKNDPYKPRPKAQGTLDLKSSDIFSITTWGSLLNAVTKYKDGSIARLVVITHSDVSTLGLSGSIEIDKKTSKSSVIFHYDPGVFWDANSRVMETFNNTSITMDMANWIGASTKGRLKLDEFIRKFTKNGEIVLISCKAGKQFIASPSHTGILAYWLKDANIMIRATGDSIWYRTKVSGSSIIDRDLISVGEFGKQGRGYRHIIPQLEKVSPVKP